MDGVTEQSFDGTESSPGDTFENAPQPPENPEDGDEPVASDSSPADNPNIQTQATTSPVEKEHGESSLPEGNQEAAGGAGVVEKVGDNSLSCRVRYSYIPTQEQITQLYPDFPNLSGLSEADKKMAVTKYWKQKNRIKYKEKIRKKREQRRIVPNWNRPIKQQKVKSFSGPSKAPRPVEKPAQNVTISCPKLTLKIYQGTNEVTRSAISEEDWKLLMSFIMDQWMNSGRVVSISNRHFANGCGHLSCDDDFSADWIRETVAKFSIEGRQFMAWAVKDLDDVKVKAEVFLDKDLADREPIVVIRSALSRLGLNGDDVKLGIVIPTPSGGRIARLFVPKGIAKVIQDRNNKVPACLTNLVFKFSKVYGKRGGNNVHVEPAPDNLGTF